VKIAGLRFTRFSFGPCDCGSYLYSVAMITNMCLLGPFNQCAQARDKRHVLFSNSIAADWTVCKWFLSVFMPSTRLALGAVPVVPLLNPAL
jgi:hypothetical protein